MRQTMKNRTLAWAINSALLAAVPTAYADTAPAAAPTGALEEIVVTARLRDESLQDTPVSVTAFSARALEDAGVRSYGDFIALTPNVSLAQSESAGQSFLTIRGLTQVRNGQAPVAFVIDGVQQVSNKQFTQEMFDLESVQVLKGPQGALYGRNASGGAIVITTKQPTNEFAGYVRAGAGNGGEYFGQAVVSGPIVDDKLLFRVAGSYVHRDGYFDNVFLGKKSDELSDKTFRGLLKWNVSDALTAELRLNYVRTDTSGAVNFQFQPVKFDPARPCFPDGANPFGGAAPDPNRVVETFCANNLGQNRRDLDEATVKLDYRFSGAVLTTILSHNKIQEYVAGDQFPYTAARNLFGAFDGTQTQFTDIRARSAEVRLASDGEGALRWMVGGYYLKTERFISTTTGSDLGLGITKIEKNPAFTDTRNPTVSWLADDNRNKSQALFANVAYDVTPKLEAALAVRYDKDERNQNVDPRNTAGVPTGCTSATLGRCTRSASFSETQPKFSLRYAVSDTAQVYASWGRGFRSGEFNQFGVGAAASTVGVVGVSDLVAPEKTDSAELGWKSEFLDRRLRLNAAVFDTTVKGQQYFVFIGQIGGQALVSINKVKIRGGEFEVVASPVDGLDVYASVGVSDSEIKEYRLNPAAIGKWAPYVPKTSFNAGAQYRFPLGESLRLVTRADFIAKGKQYWDPENTAPRGTVNLVNLRVALEGADRRWAVSGTVNNATDRRYNAEFVLGGFAQPALPRTYTVDARYNF